ncbi:MAG: DUF2284 domain-containing protein [Proteobacteria bacterium]|nr:DUF2284 domain-containing protein [Pseudomonadota bacterium]
MEGGDLKKYCDEALEKGATHAKLIFPGSVITAPWVRLKCQYGCQFGYNKCYCCPPQFADAGGDQKGPRRLPSRRFVPYGGPPHTGSGRPFQGILRDAPENGRRSLQGGVLQGLRLSGGALLPVQGVQPDQGNPLQLSGEGQTFHGRRGHRRV